ncbi:MAG: hypothetical protein ABSF35_10745 [Polyangia bacterium]|jgi:hypothetical protein
MRQAKRWLFNGTWPTIRFVFSFLGAALGAWGACTKTLDFFNWTKSTDALAFVHWYLWVSFGALLFGIALFWALYDQMWNIRDEVNGKLRQAQDSVDTISHVNHMMAEAVRQYAIETAAGDYPGRPQLDRVHDDAHLRAALGEDLNRFLAGYLGNSKITIRVKLADPGIEADAEASLLAVFTYSPKDEGKRREERMKDSESLVFMRFKEAKEPIKRVMIRDTKRLETDVTKTSSREEATRNAMYQKYAERCGFRSVLAFPLREPIPRGKVQRTLTITPVRGFLSLDSMEPDAFVALFSPRQDQPDDNDGTNLDDSGKLQLFFGLADSLASVAVLLDSKTNRNDVSSASATPPGG